MIDWKQKIADEVRKNCDHQEPGGLGPGCDNCHGVYLSVIKIVGEMLDNLSQDLDVIPLTGQTVQQLIEEYKRSIPA